MIAIYIQTAFSLHSTNHTINLVVYILEIFLRFDPFSFFFFHPIALFNQFIFLKFELLLLFLQFFLLFFQSITQINLTGFCF